MRLIAGFAALLILGGCAQIAQIPDDVLAKDLNKGARKAVSYGLSYAIRKAPADAQKIKDAAQIGDTILKQNIIPIFSGATTGDVARSAVDTALSLLDSKIGNPEVVAAIQLAIDILSANINLPTNPADKLDARTKMALNGLFTGMSSGIEDVLTPTPAVTPVPPPVPPTTPPAPTPAPAAPAARQSTKLHWN